MNAGNSHVFLFVVVYVFGGFSLALLRDFFAPCTLACEFLQHGNFSAQILLLIIRVVDAAFREIPKYFATTVVVLKFFAESFWQARFLRYLAPPPLPTTAFSRQRLSAENILEIHALFRRRQRLLTRRAGCESRRRVR